MQQSPLELKLQEHPLWLRALPSRPTWAKVLPLQFGRAGFDPQGSGWHCLCNLTKVPTSALLLDPPPGLGSCDHTSPAAESYVQ